MSKELTADEKLNIIGTEYAIPVEDHLREDVKIMCNLGKGIKEEGIALGKEEVIVNMYKNGFTLQQITVAVQKSVEEVEEIIKKRELVIV